MSIVDKRAEVMVYILSNMGLIVEVEPHPLTGEPDRTVLRIALDVEDGEGRKVQLTSSRFVVPYSKTALLSPGANVDLLWKPIMEWLEESVLRIWGVDTSQMDPLFECSPK